MRPIILFLDEPVQDIIKQEGILYVREKAVYNPKKVEIIYTHFTEINYEKFPNLKYVLCPCTGIKHLNPEEHPNVNFIYLDDKEWLFNNALSTAEWTFYAMLKMLRHKRDELNGKSIGFVGFGRVAQQVCRMLQGFNVVIGYTDIKEPKYFKKGAIKCNLTTVLKCDIVSVHLAETRFTRNFISKPEFKIMSNSAVKPYFVNSSRSSIVDGNELMSAIGRLVFSGVMLDVFEDYEAQIQKELWVMNSDYFLNVHMTPHIAGKGKVSRDNTDDFVFQKLNNFLRRENT